MFVFLVAAPVLAQSVTVQPPSGGFPNTAVGLKSIAIDFVLTNTGTTTLTVLNVSTTPSEFVFYTGWTPFVLKPGQATHYALKFIPDAAQTFSGNMTVTFDSGPPLVVALQGTGLSTSAIASVSTTSMTFPNQLAGTISPAQTVTITNTGTTALKTTTLTVNPPFAVTGFLATTLNPGSSTSFQVTMFGTTPGTFNSELVVSYDVVPPTGIDLTGNTISSTAFAVTTFPTLPAATVKSPYLAKLTAVGGTPPYTWSLAAGSILPSGLSISSDGTLSGTLTSVVTAKNYFFSVKAIDSSPNPKKALEKLTFPVNKTTNANCNNISWNIAGTSTPMVPINDLGTGTYLGAEGGLYPNGSNQRPTDHDSAGIAIAQSIQPLDANGNPDPNGKYAFMSIGESATFNSFTQFQIDIAADQARNSHLVIIPGAQPRTTAAMYADPNNAVWNPIFQYFLPQNGITANQVVAAWVDVVDGSPTGTFPTDMTKYQGELEAIAQNLHTKFPNLQLAYFTSKNYDGYSNGISTIYPEPYGYESGFAVKDAIQDQLNGLASLNFDSTKGPVMAPWMAWGPYDWTNGLIARSDGLVLTCSDVTNDGIHPTLPAGREKESNELLNFLKTDTTTAPWFLAH
jgi:hypothetical protein